MFSLNSSGTLFSNSSEDIKYMYEDIQSYTTYQTRFELDYDISKENTYTNPKKFFSHRYCYINKIKYCGRQISLVGIKNN